MIAATAAAEVDRLALWREIMSDRADARGLREAAAAIDPHDVAAVARLRRDTPPELAAAALDLAEARRRARRKFGARAELLAADPAGVEMASSLHSARHKARRIAQRLGPGATVLDLCCGIGGDAVGLVEAGLAVTAVDRDPLRAWMAAHNAGCGSLIADVERVGPQEHPAAAFLLDPARRTDQRGAGQRRIWRLDDYVPGPAAIRAIISARRDGAVKLGPGVEWSEALALVPAGLAAEVEYLSEDGRATQCILWTGRLAEEAGMDAMAEARTRATGLKGEDGTTVFSLAGDPAQGVPRTDDPAGTGWLMECDDAVERARLLAEVCGAYSRAAELHPGLGLLCAPDGCAEPAGSALYTRFRVLDAGTWSVKRVRGVLRRLGAGVVEVKVRGGAANAEALQRDLRGDGSRALTVFVLRLGTCVWCFISERADGQESR